MITSYFYPIVIISLGELQVTYDIIYCRLLINIHVTSILHKKKKKKKCKKRRRWLKISLNGLSFLGYKR